MISGDLCNGTLFESSLATIDFAILQSGIIQPSIRETVAPRRDTFEDAGFIIRTGVSTVIESGIILPLKPSTTIFHYHLYISQSDLDIVCVWRQHIDNIVYTSNIALDALEMTSIIEIKSTIMLSDLLECIYICFRFYTLRERVVDVSVYIHIYTI